MNIYSQNLGTGLNSIPVWITLSYKGDNWYDIASSLKFPINPEQIKKDIPSPSDTVEIEGLGEVSIPKTPQLARITITSFFWDEVDLVPKEQYIQWLEHWQESKKPALLLVTRFNYSMYVTCENFSHWIKAGEEDTVYFSLEMMEYRYHQAKRIGTVTFSDAINTIQKYTSIPAMVLVGIPRPSRTTVTKKVILNPYVTSEGETILSITKKITGKETDWQKLYERNKDALACVADGSEIPTGTSLILPDEWFSGLNQTVLSGD